MGPLHLVLASVWRARTQLSMPSRKQSCAARTAGLFCFCLFSATTLIASDYFVRSWQVEDGLPQNSVTAIIQTHDGYVWVGTYTGLARFDGVRFTSFDENNTPELHNSR